VKVDGGRRGDAGFTLVELAVAMLVTGVLAAGVGTIMLGTVRMTNTMNTKVSMAADTRTAMQIMSRDLRGTVVPLNVTPAVTALTTATASAVTFYTMLDRPGGATYNGDPVPTKVEFYLSGTCLTMAQTPGTVVAGSGFSWPASGRTTRCILRNAAAPAFLYYDTGTGTTPLTQPLASLAAVRSLDITVSVTDPKNPTVPASVLTTRVVLDNVVLADKGGTA